MHVVLVGLEGRGYAFCAEVHFCPDMGSLVAVAVLPDPETEPAESEDLPGDEVELGLAKDSPYEVLVEVGLLDEVFLLVVVHIIELVPQFEHLGPSLPELNLYKVVGVLPLDHFLGGEDLELFLADDDGWGGIKREGLPLLEISKVSSL